ncbi:unnamed protein product [Rangifer tarandus platyrhynchus]|uniref:Uncharacterized protein n=1 Tax=Rangifer tarandus platyrhynchus TaxID=3082113 RepID=A0AC59ZEV6_RANTA
MRLCRGPHSLPTLCFCSVTNKRLCCARKQGVFSKATLAWPVRTHKWEEAKIRGPEGAAEVWGSRGGGPQFGLDKRRASKGWGRSGSGAGCPESHGRPRPARARATGSDGRRVDGPPAPLAPHSTPHRASRTRLAARLSRRPRLSRLRRSAAPLPRTRTDLSRLPPAPPPPPSHRLRRRLRLLPKLFPLIPGSARRPRRHTLRGPAPPPPARRHRAARPRPLFSTPPSASVAANHRTPGIRPLTLPLRPPHAAPGPPAAPSGAQGEAEAEAPGPLQQGPERHH